jgi:fatty acid synthase subunit alpha, fungi type
MRSIFPATIDGDLLKLIHLSNSFRMVGVAKPLRVGDVCYSEARIASVTNIDAGKVVKVKGHVYRTDAPVVEVVSAFLYRDRLTVYENTFEITEEPDYLADLLDDAAVGVLQSKECFEWDHLCHFKLELRSFSVCNRRSLTQIKHHIEMCLHQATYSSAIN